MFLKIVLFFLIAYQFDIGASKPQNQYPLNDNYGRENYGNYNPYPPTQPPYNPYISMGICLSFVSEFLT